MLGKFSPESLQAFAEALDLNTDNQDFSEGFFEFKELPPRYKKGLNSKEEESLKATAKKRMGMKNVGAKELFEPFPSDKSFNKRQAEQGKKMPQSEATKAYKDKFSNDNAEMDFAEDGLAKKAKESGFSLSVLRQVYAKGMAAWKGGHRPGVPAQAWAMGRVNSFITGKGGARKADADLFKKAKK